MERPNPHDHLRLAWHQANRFYRSYEDSGWGLTRSDREDIRQEAVVAMLHACRQFDPAMGSSWTRYCCVAIRRHLQRWLRRHPAVEMPDRLENNMLRRYEIVDQHGRDRLQSREMEPSESAFLRELRAAVDRLEPKQAAILRSRYGLDGEEKTLQEIADESGVTRERIRQKQVKAEKELCRQMGADDE